MYNTFSIIKFVNDNQNSNKNYFFNNNWNNSGIDNFLKKIITETNIDIEKDFLELNDGIIKIKIDGTIDEYFDSNKNFNSFEYIY